MSSFYLPEKRLEDDPIEPVSITHKVDELWEDGRLSNRYNWLAYVFRLDGAEMMARCYLDDCREVSLYGASLVRDGNGPFVQVDAPVLRDLVIRYMTRRFHVITELPEDGEHGYQPIWIIARPSWMKNEPWPPGWRGLEPDESPPLPLPELPSKG